jgi:hypothetical protein
MPSDEKSINPKLKLLSNFCKRISKPLIILADSNSHSTMTGPDTNKRGEKLEDFLFDNDLQLANDGPVPTFQTSWCKTFIDITAHNHYLEQSIQYWRVDPRESFSDHKFIQFEVECEIIAEEQVLNFKKANWRVFDKYIRKNIHKINKANDLKSPDNFDKYALAFEALIQEALRVSCPMNKSGKHKSVKWWSRDLARMIKTTRKLYRKWKLTNDEKFDMLYHDCKHEYDLLIKKEKEASWDSLISGIDTDKATSRLIKNITNLKGSEIGFLDKGDGTYTTTPEDTVKLLMDTHFPNNKDLQVLEGEAQPKDWENGPFKIHYIKTKQVVKVVNKFGPDKASGFDNISPRALQNLPAAAFEVLG